jgi:acylphosphatase
LILDNNTKTALNRFGSAPIHLILQGTTMETHFDITISGRVQGVGFRYSAQQMARSLNLKGWIQNLPDGSVFAVIEGPVEACNSFIHWCRQGTGYSWVEKVDLVEKVPEGLGSFTVRH